MFKHLVPSKRYKYLNYSKVVRRSEKSATRLHLLIHLRRGVLIDNFIAIKSFVLVRLKPLPANLFLHEIKKQLKTREARSKSCSSDESRFSQIRSAMKVTTSDFNCFEIRLKAWERRGIYGFFKCFCDKAFFSFWLLDRKASSGSLRSLFWEKL